MVTDLQEVDRVQQATRDESGFDRCLGIASQEGAELAERELEDDRSVVDVPFGQGSRRIGLRWIQDADRCRGIQSHLLPCAGEMDWDVGGLRIAEKAGVRGILEADPRVQHRTDPEAVEHLHQPGDVVLVRMAEHEQIDSARVERQVRADPTQRELGIGTAVDEHRRAARRLDEDRVALADVEHGDMQHSVRAVGDGDDEEDRDEATEDRKRTQEVGERPCHGAGLHDGRSLGSRWLAGRWLAAERPRAEGEDREPGGRERCRHLDVDGRERHRRRRLPQGDDDEQDQPGGAAGQPCGELAQERTTSARSTTPTSDATALNSIATGTNGTTSTLAIGATSEILSKLTRTTGRVVSWAARVRAIGSRIHAGQPGRRRSTDAPNQTRPAVASSESWKPTSHSTGGAARSMTSAARASAEAACAREPPIRATSIAPAMSAARTTDGLAPVSIT